MVQTEGICIDQDVYLTPDVEKDLSDRLSRIEGQVRGLKKMLLEHKDCESLLIQAAAIKGAITEVTIKLLEGHMETCVADCVERGQGVEALEKLKGALEKVLRKS